MGFERALFQSQPRDTYMPVAYTRLNKSMNESQLRIKPKLRRPTEDVRVREFKVRIAT